MDNKTKEALKSARAQIESFALHFQSLGIVPEYQRGLRCMSDIDSLLTDNTELSEKLKMQSDDADFVSEYLKTTREWYEQGHAELGEEISGIESEGDYAEAAFQRLIDSINESQKAHETIASICFKARVESPDGTSVGAVINMAKLVEELRKKLELP